MDVLVAHGGEELHVFLNLGYVFRLGGTKLKVDHDPLLAIGHDTIGATFAHLTIIVDREDGTLVEERPSG